MTMRERLRDLFGTREIIATLKTITQELKKMSQADDEILANMKLFDEATTAIAARLDKALAGQPLSAAAKAAVSAELARLTALGADPDNPIPA